MTRILAAEILDGLTQLSTYLPESSHKAPQVAGPGDVPHENPTNKTTLVGTQRYGCYGALLTLTSLYASEQG
jgi:hypothetical protein